MQIEVPLFVQQYHNNSYCIEVIGEANICVYTDDLDKGREELELYLNDRVERLHPRYQSKYAQPPNQVFECIELPDILKLIGPRGAQQAPTQVSIVVIEDRKWKRLWFPRWDCHYWLPQHADLSAEVSDFLQRHVLQKMSPHERLQHRHEKKEWMETLLIEAEPPSLEAFTGKLLGAELLPPPRDQSHAKKREEQEDEDDEENESTEKNEEEKKRDRQKAKKKKKRPPTPTLEKLGVPLHRLAKEQELERAYGRDKEVSDLLRILQSPGGSALALIGPSGVGKTTILNELVYRIRDKTLPKTFRTRPVWFVDASRLVAGDGWFGDWQRQCLDVIQECIDAEVVLYIGALLPLLDAGKSINSDQNVSFLLRPYLASKRITLLGECTPQAWAQLELRDVGFSRLFVPYQVEEPSEDGIRHILQLVSKDIHEEMALESRPDFLAAVLELSRRFSSDGSLLGNAIHFLRRITNEAFLLDKEVLTRMEAIQQFCSETGLPEFLIRDDLPLDPESIWLQFRQRLIGQEEAVRRMTDLVSMIKAGLSDLDRPLGSFLFVGPTGVGKTEMAKTLTQFLFGREDRLIRFDMSEFISPSSVHRFLGTSDEEGKLVSAIRRTPFSVLLLDEVEKAHPSVFDVLLQVLGEARLTDEIGRTANFRNVVVLMTSNLGVGTLRRSMGFGETTAKQFRDHFIAEAEQFFRPEFFNRIDYIIPFAPLHKDAIDLITDRELSKFLRREGLHQRNVELQLDDAIPEWLAERGVDPRYGARPLKRVLKQQLNAPLSRHLSTLSPHQQHTIKVQADPERLSFANMASSQKSREQSQSRQQLLKLLQQINTARFQMQRWMRTTLYKELRQEVRLFDRLSQDKNFWADRRMAEERMGHIKSGRQLIDSFRQLRDQVASLEDLAFESYYDRNIEPLESLRHELSASDTQLSLLELQLYAKLYRHPNHAVLYLSETKGSSSFLRKLYTMYGHIAHEYKWSITAYNSRYLSIDTLNQLGLESHLFETEQDRKKAKAEDRQHKKAAAALEKENSQPSDPPRKKRTKDKKVQTPLEHLRWLWYRGPELPYDQDEETLSKRIRQFCDNMFGISEAGSPKALVIQGQFAACLLAHEQGLHQWIESHNSHLNQVRILAYDQPINSFERFAHPLTPQEAQDLSLPGPLTALRHPTYFNGTWPTQKKRVINENNKQVQDFELDIHYFLENRTYLVYQRMMRAGMYHRLFGKQGLGWFKKENK